MAKEEAYQAQCKVKLRQAAARACRNAPQEFEDAYACALAATWHARAAYAPQSLIYTIAFRAAFDHLRGWHDARTTARLTLVSLDELKAAGFEPPYDGGISALLARLTLEPLLADLDDRQRRIVSRLHLGRESLVEIAETEGCSPQRIDQIARAALKKMRQAALLDEEKRTP